MKTVFPKFQHKQRSKAPVVLALLLAPLLAYGAFLMMLILLDSWRGDGLLPHQYYFESRRQLALQLLSDARKGLPVFYVAGLLLWLQAAMLTRYRKWNVILAVAVTGVLAGFVAAAVFLGMTGSAILPVVMSSLLLSVVLAWAAARAAAV